MDCQQVVILIGAWFLRWPGKDRRWGRRRQAARKAGDEAFQELAGGAVLSARAGVLRRLRVFQHSAHPPMNSLDVLRYLQEVCGYLDYEKGFLFDGHILRSEYWLCSSAEPAQDPSTPRSITEGHFHCFSCFGVVFEAGMILPPKKGLGASS